MILGNITIIYYQILCARAFLPMPSCGERGIRTLDTISHGIHALQACALDHSATSPGLKWRAQNTKKINKYKSMKWLFHH
jgi:hypothetical protein